MRRYFCSGLSQALFLHLIFPVVCSIFCLNVSAADDSLLSVTNYKLNIQLQIKEGKLNAEAELTLRNNTKHQISKNSFLLYRLLNVKSIYDESDRKILFTQEVVSLIDEPVFQVNFIQYSLTSQLLPGEQIKIKIFYEGFILGYQEIMDYVRDKIDEKYSLLRPDAFAYPFIASNMFRSVLQGYDNLFSYNIKITVPSDYIVACGGKLIKVLPNGKDKEFNFENIVPVWRMDIAVAKFRSLRNEKQNLTVNYLPEDEEGAKVVMAAMQRSINFYTEIFGKPVKYSGYNVIEIPDGWGSQTGDFYFLQAAAAFKDTNRLHELYHEIGHTWNVKANKSVRNCRWFDEAFASYFEALSLKEFNGQEAFLKRMEQYRTSFLRNVKNDSTVFYTSIAGYGNLNLGVNSYLKGPWSLYILHSILGDKMFKDLIRKSLSEYSYKEMDFDDFRVFANNLTGRNLDKFFNDWIFGIESSKQLAGGLTAKEISILY